MADYDRIYKTANYFGDPYDGIFSFFERLPTRGHLCDLGAGQGRDAIPLAKLGFRVTAVDQSAVGLMAIKAQNPDIECICADYFNFPVGAFDIVFMDSILHFYKQHRETESNFVAKLFHEMKQGAIFAVCIHKTRGAPLQFLKAICDTKLPFALLQDSAHDYAGKNRKYQFIAIKKL